MQTIGIILSIIIICFRLKHWKREPDNLGWILAEVCWWVVLLFLLMCTSCTPTKKLQKEPSYEQYQKNTQWKI